MGRSLADLAAETDRGLVDGALSALGIGAWSYDIRADRFRCDGRTARLFGLSEEERRGVPIARVGEAVHPDDRELFAARRRFTLRFGGDFSLEYRTARLFGLSEEERRGVPIARVGEAVHPDDRELFAARRRFTLRFGGDFSLEYRTVPRHGSIHRVMARGYYSADGAGTLVEARGIVIDLTDRDADIGAQVFDATAVDGMTPGPAIERAALHAIAAHRAIKESDTREGRMLRPAADALLSEILRVIALSAPARGLGH